MDEKCHPECQSMSAVESVREARGWAELLEKNEVRRTGLTRSEVRPIVARKVGVPASKLYSLWRNRLKDTGSWKERLRAAVVRELQSELARLQHEQNLLAQTGAHPASHEASAVLADIDAVHVALGLPRNDICAGPGDEGGECSGEPG